MNFKDWYNETLAKEHTPEKLRAAEHGWDACKSEILDIIDGYQYTEKDVVFVVSEILEKIENL